MEHFAPHPTAAFEGYYSKFDLPSGAHIALIICSVPRASSLPPHMVSFTYYPATGAPIYQREHWVPSISRTATGPHHAFTLRIPGLGSVAVEPDSTTTYDLDTGDWTLHAMTAGRTPWRPGAARDNTPEGWLVRFPLPLHWHVHSLASPAAFQLSIPALRLPRADRAGRASIHQEKNWASSFPASHVWLQARDHAHDRGICLAGGTVLGMHAFILGYRDRELSVDILPPFALSVLGVAPFMAFDVDYKSRGFSLTASNLRYRVAVRARAPREKGWFGLGAPFPEGHRRNFCTESFLAEVEVEVHERNGWWGWKEVRRERFECASLEFAGGWFPERGEKK